MRNDMPEPDAERRPVRRTRSMRAWLKAARLPSQLYIFLPLLAGQLYGRAAGYKLDPWIFAMVHAFGLFIQLYIVTANDWADIETDRANTMFTLYSGGSRVLVDGDLPRSALAAAAVGSGILAVLSAAAIGIAAGRWLAVPLALVAILMLLLYSYAPAKLNYRGGGELLQMLGTGVVLPVFGWYAQTGTLAGFPVAFLSFLLPTMLACAIGTSLPDEVSDRSGGKRSAAVLLGQRPAQALTAVLHCISVAVLVLVFAEQGGPPGKLFAIAAATAVAVQGFLFGGRPGTVRLFAFGSASIAATLLLTLASAVRIPLSPYRFLMLCLLLTIPGAAIWTVRSDLRRMMGVTAGAALPFALFEPLFLDRYWSPTFLFRLDAILGFGLEDFLFVSALGAIGSGLYPALLRKGLAPCDRPLARVRRLLPAAIAAAMLVALFAAGIPPLALACATMGAFLVATGAMRPDLSVPAVLGGCATALAYWLVCLVFAWLYPGVFGSTWNPDALTGLAMLGVPIEEPFYAMLAGGTATVFYPLVANRRFVPAMAGSDGMKGRTSE